MFRDLGDPDADPKQAKAVVAARIFVVPDDRGRSLRKAGALTRFAAADFSRVRNATSGRFMLDRLIKMLAAPDGDLRVTVHVDARPERAPAVVTPGSRDGSPLPAVTRRSLCRPG